MFEKLQAEYYKSKNTCYHIIVNILQTKFGSFHTRTRSLATTACFHLFHSSSVQLLYLFPRAFTGEFTGYQWTGLCPLQTKFTHHIFFFFLMHRELVDIIYETLKNDIIAWPRIVPKMSPNTPVKNRDFHGILCPWSFCRNLAFFLLIKLQFF